MRLCINAQVFVTQNNVKLCEKGREMAKWYGSDRL